MNHEGLFRVFFSGSSRRGLDELRAEVRDELRAEVRAELADETRRALLILSGEIVRLRNERDEAREGADRLSLTRDCWFKACERARKERDELRDELAELRAKGSAL